MKFGFDIDDTLIDLRRHGFNIYKKKLVKDVCETEFDKLDTVEIHRLFDLTNEEGKNMWISSMEDIYFTDCPAFPDALETIQALANEGHDIYYITSRPKKFCPRTKAWMKSNGFPVKDENFFCGMEDHEKIDIIKNLQLDYYIDDKPAVVDTLQGIETKVLLKNQSYNQSVSLPRLVNWCDFKALL
jgi:uncharacterized protein